MQYTFCSLAKLSDRLSSSVSKGITNIVLDRNVLNVCVDSNSLFKVASVLKFSQGLRFESVTDVWGVDRPNLPYRFKVGYNFLSLFHNIRVVVYATIPKLRALESLSGLYPSVNWLEREVWDMFGIFFSGHPDLRRILTDYGFSGFPLRKDFPLSGYTQVRYDEETKKVLLEPLELSQEFRQFDFLSPWERLQE